MKELAAYEALLFIAGEEGLKLEELAQLTRSTADHVSVSLDKLKSKYEADENSGLTLIETADNVRLVTKKSFSPLIQLYAQSPLSKQLSKASIETLAVIAYKQPITRMEIEEIRGVQLSSSLQKLKLRQLIQEIGRLDAPGKPVLYGTTEYFLDYFGLNDLTELPELEVEEELTSQSLFDDITEF
ncbi:MAG: SMC-Scp complex subunit ScpB [Alkalibacterium sp.]|nr:SMC-Scp complex subunit ScpB [Alkalibacterium sp.]TVP92529.1 MAG: SMC-Scp complex subunit ScpB [Alkalibacterium sp.]